MRVLIVSFYFPPYSAVGAVRTGKTAKFLTEFGHDVRVLTAAEQDTPHRTLPVELHADAVDYTHWMSVRAPIDFVVGKGRVTGWGGSEDAAGARPSLSHRLLRGVKALAYFPDVNVGWLPFAVTAGLRRIRDWRPDVIYASASPYTALCVAMLLSRASGIPWVAELRDLWTDNHAYSHPTWRRRVDRYLEGVVLRSASAVITVSPPLAETLTARHTRPVHVVTNGFDPADYGAPDLTTTHDAETLRIVHTGHVYGERQSAAPLFDAMQRLGADGKRVRVVLYGSPAPSLEREAQRFGMADQIECDGPVPYSASLRAQASADILLSLLWNDPRQPGIYTTKLFEYLGARRPILAVGHTAGNGAATLIREQQAGIATNDPEQIATFLQTQLRSKREHGIIPELPSSVGLGYSREEQTRVLERVLLHVVRQ